MQERKRRTRTPGLHPQLSRRYEHADFARRNRSARSRRTATLLRAGLDAVQKHYAAKLDLEMQQALHDAVVRIIRPQVDPDWSEDDASARALTIAAELLQEPLRED